MPSRSHFPFAERTFGALLAFTILVGGLGAVAQEQPAEPGWYSDKSSKCRFWTSVQMKSAIGEYKGDCKEEFANGRGEYTIRSKSDTITFSGELLDGKPNGQGAATLSNGRKYSGQWEKGLPSGQGRMLFKSGVSFSGDFRGGAPTGEGVLEWPGHRYVGGVSGSTETVTPQGNGTLILADGTSVSGHWLEGAPDGEAVRRLPDGSGYAGQWKRGRPDGRGEITVPGGLKIKGEMHNDRMLGATLVTETDGRQIEVEFFESDKPRATKTTYPDGSSYVGQYNDNIRAHGNGVRTYLDGRRETGEFLDGTLSGQGTIEFPDGRRYDGGCIKGQPTGFGVMTQADGTKVRGEWVNGEPRNPTGHAAGERNPGQQPDQQTQGCRGYLPDGSCYRPIGTLPPNIAELIPRRPSPPARPIYEETAADIGERPSQPQQPRRSGTGNKKVPPRGADSAGEGQQQQGFSIAAMKRRMIPPTCDARSTGHDYAAGCRLGPKCAGLYEWLCDGGFDTGGMMCCRGAACRVPESDCDAFITAGRASGLMP